MQCQLEKRDINRDAELPLSDHTERLRTLLAFAGVLALTTLLAGCGGSSTHTPSGPTSPGLTPTTTLQAETSNNTSAADSFVRLTNGNAGAGNVSKVSVQSLLYSGSNTKTYVTWVGWFGRS